jgi:PAS domain-containing protein
VLEYLDCTVEEIRNTGWFGVMHPEDREGAEQKWQEAIEAQEPFEEEFRLKRGRDDAYRWFLCRAVPEEDPESGEAKLKWFGTNTDITEQK